MTKLLLVEDEDDLAFGVERALARAGLDAPVRARSGAEAERALLQHEVEVALLDLGLPDGDGLDLLPRMLATTPDCRIIVLTGRDDPRLAVRAVKAGAVDYLVKPFATEDLILCIHRARREAQLRRELESVRRARPREEDVAIGDSPVWRAVLAQVRIAAEAPRAPVLVEGRSGTGKDVVASLLHRWSPRADGPFVAVNAACLPASTLESELFGHEAGAFTDAKVVRRGLFELAHGGTLFLDEIGELPLELQPKLLRVLEGLPFRRLGGEREIRVDVRVVAATNRDLAQMTREGRFREDLYWRLRVLSLHLPPLCERPGDPRLLTLHLLGKAGAQGETKHITPEAMAAIEAYPWPGNVRELRNVVEGALVRARQGALDLRHLPPELRVVRPSANVGFAPAVIAGEDDPETTLEAVTKRHVLRIWTEAGGNVTRAARALGIGRVALRRRLQEYGVHGGGES